MGKAVKGGAVQPVAAAPVAAPAAAPVAAPAAPPKAAFVTRRELENVRDSGVVGIDQIAGNVPAAVRSYLGFDEKAAVERAIKEGGVFTLARGYYYSGGGTGEKFANRMVSEFAKKGLKLKVLAAGDHFYPGFDGGAKTIAGKSSFWYTVAQISKA